MFYNSCDKNAMKAIISINNEEHAKDFYPTLEKYIKEICEVNYEGSKDPLELLTILREQEGIMKQAIK